MAVDTESDKLAGIVSKWLHALQGSEQRIAVDGHRVWIVLRDNRLVVRISSLDETAYETCVTKHHFRVGVIKLH